MHNNQEAYILAGKQRVPGDGDFSGQCLRQAFCTINFTFFPTGLAGGLSSLAAGVAIGIVGDSSVRAYGKQKNVFVAMILMLIFAEALGLYGMIIALLMNSKATAVPACENYYP